MWTWGPIAWGLIGLFLGGGLGFVFKYFYYKFNQDEGKEEGRITELILIVNCHKAEAEMVEKVFAEQRAFSIGRKD